MQPSASIQQAAQAMVDCDCGGLPVCEQGTDRLIGFITDRDIVCRLLAKNTDLTGRTVQDAMTTDLHIVTPETDLEDCVSMMERFQIRRVLVADQYGKAVGIVTQADLARLAEKNPDMKEEVEEALELISAPKASM